MTEKDLQQYLLSKYHEENEECEWKEFKNLKNDFNGKEKDDVISYVSALSNMMTWTLMPSGLPARGTNKGFQNSQKNATRGTTMSFWIKPV